MNYVMPRVVIAGLSGGSGKTMISAGLARALTRRGYKVQTFKKGPDYIDTLWLSLASGYPPRNLDPYMVPPGLLPRLFEQSCSRTAEAPDLALIEGNRGLFDGQDLCGSTSTAELARQLAAPVLVAMNCTKMTRTAAAVVMGLKAFDPGVNLAGVILNRVTRSRHRSLVKEAVESLARSKVYGLIPRRAEDPFEERYSGLYGDEAALAEAKAFERLDRVADFIEEHVDLEAVVDLARGAPPLTLGPRPAEWEEEAPPAAPRPRIGYVRDEVLWFYYTENLEALRAAGAELVPLSLLDERPWPELDGLYLGGGFPGDYAERLAGNRARQDEVARLIRSGLPTYAEGPGFYYLTRSINVNGIAYPMTGVFHFDLKLGLVPRGIGYVQAVVEKPNPFHPVGTVLNAHEFHYSDIGLPCDLAGETLFTLNKGNGMFMFKGKPCRDGLLRHNCFISHLQVFAPGAPHWARMFIKTAIAGRRPSNSPAGA